MKIKMLQTRKGTEDGFVVKQFYKDEEYDVRDGLGRQFLSAGYAEKLDDVTFNQWAQLATPRFSEVWDNN